LALGRLAGQYAIALRLGSAAACTAAGVLAAVGGISGYWLTVTIVTLCVWATVFALAVRRHGPSTWLVLADAAVIVVLITAHRHVVPARAIADGTTWMLPLASTAVFIPQLTLRPVLSLPVAGVVTATYAVTVPHPTDASFLVVQAATTATLMALVRRGGRNADAVIAAELRAEQEMRAEAARRADEKEQYRQLHDTILSTLTMTAAGAFAARSPTLSTQAARDLQVLWELPAMPGGERPGGEREAAVSLADRLQQVVAEVAPLHVSLSLTAASPPPAITEQISRCVAEALRNVARHAGVDRAEIRAHTEDDQLVVEVSDRGKGFDPQDLPQSRRGISESIRGRMTAVGGTAVLNSAPGAGTDVILRWPA
jgi:signal transduction histidine kinase